MSGIKNNKANALNMYIIQITEMEFGLQPSLAAPKYISFYNNKSNKQYVIKAYTY
jgi:hypothetical protein